MGSTPRNINRKPLGKRELFELFDLLSDKLHRRHTTARIYIIGGAAIALAYNRSRTTDDVDGRFDTGHGVLIEATREIARERGLPENWLNETAVSAIPPAPDRNAKTLYATEHLVITGASAEYLLAMKIEAGREKDIDDIGLLVKLLNIQHANDALELHARVLPDSRKKHQAPELLSRLIEDGTLAITPPTAQHHPTTPAPMWPFPPTEEEQQHARDYLDGGPNAAGHRPGLNQVIERIATARLDGSTVIGNNPARREVSLWPAFEPHTRTRPTKETEDQLDRENLGPCRSKRAAHIAARMVCDALDKHQIAHYGTTPEGSPAPPPTLDDPECRAPTQSGRRQKREAIIEHVLKAWRRESPRLIEQIREAIIPYEIEFRRALEQSRQQPKHTETNPSH
ncbi:MAG: DUF6036 family nucleotidyltransferase [Thiotrichales bacterium]|nr:DUF6036 family nucleotidyltransferase [Thiotrichales bacterium]